MKVRFNTNIKLLMKYMMGKRVICKLSFVFGMVLCMLSIQNTFARSEIDLINETYVWSTGLKDQKKEGYDSPEYQNIRISAQDKSGSSIWADDKVNGKTRYMVLKVNKNYTDYPYLYLVASFINKSSKKVTCTPDYPFAWGNYMSSPIISSIYASKSADKGIDIQVQCTDSQPRHLYYSGYISTRESYFALSDTSYGGSGFGICVNKKGVRFMAKTNRSNDSTLQDDVCGQYDGTSDGNGKQIYSIGLGDVMLSACYKRINRDDGRTEIYLDCGNDKTSVTVTFKNTATSCSINDGVINCGQGVSYLDRKGKIIFMCSGGGIGGGTCPWVTDSDEPPSYI